ncbi:hypothetical protein RMCBS344292_07469 [Rhizopus microsporus]|nr:hypothetical protein RMCBS344292_07469 [Rhizopus microsporus]
MPAARKRKAVNYDQEASDSDFVEQDTSKRHKKSKRELTPDTDEANLQDSDHELISLHSFNPAKIKIPQPKGGPFADALSPDTLMFLAELAENNDRDFMRVKAKEWDKAKRDFIDFVGLLMKEIHQVDPSVRMENAAKAVYRQHRDLRFTNDKRPYKSNLSASFSRTGRKFLDAGYHLSVKPGNQTFFAAGLWQPNKNMLASLRSSIMRNASLLREALSTEAIKDVFDGATVTEILSDEDKLKIAPANVAKDHPEIDLLRYKSFVVVKNFTDQEVISEGFVEKVMDVAEALVPFVAVLNSWV